MKYKVGDRVRIKSLDWYNKNKSKSHGTVACGDKYFEYDMKEWCGKTMTILEVYQTFYMMKEDSGSNYWTDEMIEGLVEEETALNKWTGLKVELELSKSVIGVSNVESLHGERFMSGFVKAIIPTEGYICKDENGNIINATKIVLEKKKKEYPKTYEECCNELGIINALYHTIGIDFPHRNEIESLIKLIICRDAYWKIAGEEMGLGKPWEPDWEESDGGYRYCIVNTSNNIALVREWLGKNYILSFPTEEMRDAFYENFKELIEQCKELL